MEEARGEKITIRFEERRCIHALSCVVGAPKTFHAGADGRWIFADETPVEELVEVVRQCPTGALTYERHDGGPAERAPDSNVATVRENGPLAFCADVRISGEAAGFRVALCRCGASKTKPYCDGSHARIGFTAACEREAKSADAPGGFQAERKAADRTDSGLAQESSASSDAKPGPASAENAPAACDGALSISPTTNGPLLVEGNLEIRAETGTVIQRTTKAWLCRCGASADKPFCDGSHKRIGFEAS